MSKLKDISIDILNKKEEIKLEKRKYKINFYISYVFCMIFIVFIGLIIGMWLKEPNIISYNSRLYISMIIINLIFLSKVFVVIIKNYYKF